MVKGKTRLRTRFLISFFVFFVCVSGLILYYTRNVNGQEIKESHYKYGNNSKQTLDLYTPKLQNEENLPVIIYAHGGGWSGGDKTNVKAKPEFFTKKGYAFISVNYRLYPNATYEEMANDAAAAVKWVFANANKYHFDQTNINLMGHSAGGHLMMLIITNPVYLNHAGLSSHMIHSIVNIEGPLDITSFIQRFERYKKVFGMDQKVWREASPVTYANNKNLPPMLLIAHGNMQVEPFIVATKKAGNKVEYFEAKTLSHSQLTQYLGTSHSKESLDLTNAVVQFLK